MANYGFFREEPCSVCYGDGKVWEEETTYNGAGYGRCSHCDGTGKTRNSIILNEKEIMDLYNQMKRDKGGD